jgi:hypothetical protein
MRRRAGSGAVRLPAVGASWRWTCCGMESPGSAGWWSLVEARPGWLDPLDVHGTRLLADLVGEREPTVRLALALASRQVRLGHVCLDLRATAATPGPLDDEGLPLADLCWPSLASWLAALAASPLAEVPDGAAADGRPARRCRWLSSLGALLAGPRGRVGRAPAAPMSRRPTMARRSGCACSAQRGHGQRTRRRPRLPTAAWRWAPAGRARCCDCWRSDRAGAGRRRHRGCCAGADRQGRWSHGGVGGGGVGTLASG